MPETTDILISLESHYAIDVFEGLKTVEFRRRRPNVPVQTRMWVYAKLPLGAILGTATISNIITKSVNRMWRLHGSCSSLTRREFFRYFEGCEHAHALVLGQPTPLEKQITLSELRELDAKFHPPQFFCRLNNPRLNAHLAIPA